MRHRRDLDKFIDETRASQRNIVFPDTVRNGRSVDVFFWRGSPAPTLVQRIAAWMLGLTFIGNGLVLFGLAVRMRPESWGVSWIMTFGSFCSILIGMRTFRNGFPRPTKPTENSN